MVPSRYPRLACTTCDSEKFEIDVRFDIFCGGCGKWIENIEVKKK
jgi:hypothetical protein